ncbi:MAG: DNA cytosine methyltransferase [Bacteroidales bacterium]
MEENISAIDLFCGIGGLSFGLRKAGLNVKAGIDQDLSCSYAYTKNNNADFIGDDISKIQGQDLIDLYWNNDEIRVLVGCAPCQPFSTHSNKIKGKENGDKWNLINQFKRLIKETNPMVVSMENVPNLSNKEIFNEFISFLKESNYFVSYSNIFCPDYGIPQKRRRLVLLASRLGEIKIINKTHTPNNYIPISNIISHLPMVNAGEKSNEDPLHYPLNLSSKNLERMISSKPNGTWKDWDESLRLKCHNKASGKTYTSVYGRMSWDEPSPTITTQFYNFGTGRFGHPEQNRALTIREAALLQTFPKDYIFYEDEKDISFKKLGTHIGNAVPVDLGYIIGKSIIENINMFAK